jgi:hypothetical protein
VSISLISPDAAEKRERQAQERKEPQSDGEDGADQDAAGGGQIVLGG